MEYQRSFSAWVSSHSGGGRKRRRLWDAGRDVDYEHVEGLDEEASVEHLNAQVETTLLDVAEEAPLALVSPACERMRGGDVSKERRHPRCRAAAASPANDDPLELVAPVHRLELLQRRLTLLQKRVAHVGAILEDVRAVLHPDWVFRRRVRW